MFLMKIWLVGVGDELWPSEDAHKDGVVVEATPDQLQAWREAEAVYQEAQEEMRAVLTLAEDSQGSTAEWAVVTWPSPSSGAALRQRLHRTSCFYFEEAMATPEAEVGALMKMQEAIEAVRQSPTMTACRKCAKDALYLFTGFREYVRIAEPQWEGLDAGVISRQNVFVGARRVGHMDSLGGLGVGRTGYRFTARDGRVETFDERGRCEDIVREMLNLPNPVLGRGA